MTYWHMQLQDNTPLPIVVIAGKNGTGKITLLEYLANYKGNEEDFVDINKTEDNKYHSFIETIYKKLQVG